MNKKRFNAARKPGREGLYKRGISLEEYITNRPYNIWYS